MNNMCRNAVFTLLTLLISYSGWSQICFECGDGSQGSFIVQKDTLLPSGDYQFTDIYIAEGATVQFSGSLPVNLHCKGSAIIDGKIYLNGSNGYSATDNLTNTMAGIGGPGGYDGGSGLAGQLLSGPGENGNGPGYGSGGSTQNNGGSGAGYGTAGLQCTNQLTNTYGDVFLNGIRGGSGGGSGSSYNGYSSGAGGGGGGALTIYACNALMIGIHGEIRADGGNGGNGFDLGAGGGGGSGGSIYIISSLVVNKGIISTEGGIGGVCPSSSMPCMHGGKGGSGRIRIDYSELENEGTIIPDFYSKQMFNAGIRRVVDARCHSTSTGFIRCRAHGGEKPYTFNWSTGALSSELVNVPAGTYTVTISDASGCSITETAVIHEPDLMQSRVITYPPSCDNADNSLVLYSASGGTPYPYQNTLATTQWSNISANGLLFTFDLERPTNLRKILLSLKQQGQQHLEVFYCQGDGTSYVNDPGHWTQVANIQFNYQATEDETPVDLSALAHLPAGKHTLYIYSHNSQMQGVSSGALGNTFNFDHQLTIYAGTARSQAADPFSTNAAGIMNLAGRIQYEIESPNGHPYLYGNNNLDGPVKTGLLPGNYTTLISDAMGCSSQAQFKIEEPEPLAIDVTRSVSPRCSDSEDGVIEVELTSPELKSYIATPPGTALHQTGIFLNFSTAENTRLAAIELYATSPVTADIFLKRGPYLGFENNSSAWTQIGQSVSVSPDASDRVYLPLNITTLDPDQWSICIRATSGDFNGLTSRENFINSSTLHLNSTAFISTGPFNQTTFLNGQYFAGTLHCSTDAGQLNTIWNNQVTGTSNPGLGAGEYTVTVEYGNQCSTSNTVTLTAPSPIQASVITAPETDHHGDGSIQVNATGGTPPYYIQWPASGITGHQLDQLTSGSYPVFIADANGCIFRDTILLQRFETPIKQEGWLTIVPNPGHGFIKVGEEVKGMEACTLSVFDVLGRLVIQQSTTISGLMSTGLDMHHLIDANYIIQVRDEDQVYQARAIIIH